MNVIVVGRGVWWMMDLVKKGVKWNVLREKKRNSVVWFVLSWSAFCSF